MSQYPGFADPYPMPPVNPRPTSVTVLAIVGIVWGVLMLLCNGFGLIPALVPDFGGPNPALEEMRNHPVASTWNIVGPLLGLGLAVLLIAGSIGALGLRRWGRAALMFYAVLGIILGIVSVVIQVAVMNPITAKMLPPEMAANSQMLGIAQFGAAAVALLVALALPVWIVIVMTRPRVKAAFAGNVGTAAPGYIGVGGAGGAGAGLTHPPGYGAGQQYPPQGPYGQ